MLSQAPLLPWPPLKVCWLPTRRAPPAGRAHSCSGPEKTCWDRPGTHARTAASLGRACTNRCTLCATAPCAPGGLLHDLGRHPAGRADKGVARHVLVAPGAAALHSRRHAKVRQHHLPIGIYQDVTRLRTHSTAQLHLYLTHLIWAACKA